MIAKYETDPDGFYFDDTLDARAIAALPGKSTGKLNRRGEKVKI